MLWEVEGKWVVQGAVDVDIGANPSAEGGDEQRRRRPSRKVCRHFRSSGATSIRQAAVCNVHGKLHDDGSLVFAYHKDGATDPTFLYFVYGLKEAKC
ncbi:hypothetical protein F3Y22_tig00110393pilonHSYRG00179 [Hibiscus syriacus]|uniref:TCTP domain-containing protein n=1 Tax=Hibiscus syriacus TaxID=106335 RepID=A0A6A3AU55_HIBSY|nr:hypothetical protein F3Y22_tig00110393pilonHSYRG00179 [Hibiscus syriacus]